jgi:hypothetical protein
MRRVEQVVDDLVSLDDSEMRVSQVHRAEAILARASVSRSPSSAQRLELWCGEGVTGLQETFVQVHPSATAPREGRACPKHLRSPSVQGTCDPTLSLNGEGIPRERSTSWYASRALHHGSRHARSQATLTKGER